MLYVAQKHDEVVAVGTAVGVGKGAATDVAGRMDVDGGGGDQRRMARGAAEGNPAVHMRCEMGIDGPANGTRG